METTTIADKLFAIALETANYPTAQRVLRSGLKRVTGKDLYERWAIEATVTAQNESIRAKMIEALEIMPTGAIEIDQETMNGMHSRHYGGRSFGSSGNHVPRIPEFWETVGHKFSGNTASYVITKNGEEGRESYNVTQHAFWKGVTGSVQFLPIENYMTDIPERVMHSYLAACELGFPKFLVASPHIEAAHWGGVQFKVGETTLMEGLPRVSDPVLVGVLNGIMFEIDYWE